REGAVRTSVWVGMNITTVFGWPSAIAGQLGESRQCGLRLNIRHVIGIGTSLTISAHGYQNNVASKLLKILIAQSHVVHDAGREVIHHHITGADELARRL